MGSGSIQASRISSKVPNWPPLNRILQLRIPWLTHIPLDPATTPAWTVFRIQAEVRGN